MQSKVTRLGLGNDVRIIAGRFLKAEPSLRQFFDSWTAYTAGIKKIDNCIKASSYLSGKPSRMEDAALPDNLPDLNPLTDVTGPDSPFWDFDATETRNIFGIFKPGPDDEECIYSIVEARIKRLDAAWQTPVGWRALVHGKKVSRRMYGN